MGAPRANSTTASAHTPLFFSLPPSSCVYRSLITHSASVSLFLFVIFRYFFPVISCASSSSFPFCCRSVVLRPYLRVPWHSCVAIFLFVVVLFSTLLCISHYYSYPLLLCFFLPWNYCRENGDFTSGRVLFLDQIFLGRPVPRERESLPALLTSSNKKIHILQHVYKPLSSLYVCVSVFLWPLGVYVEWDVTGSLPCSTHKSNSTCFFLLLVWHDAPGCPRYTLQHYRVCVWYTQALVLDRPYMPPSNPSCTHTHLKAKED